MNIIKRNIFLLTDSIQAPICIVEGSDLYSMEFTVRDFNIPEGASAVAYAAGVKSKTKTRICEIDGNTITLEPTDTLFEEGFNMLQIRIFSGEKSITSFNNPVHCHKSIVTDDASETESDPTLLEQILSKLNEVPEAPEISEEKVKEIIEEYLKENPVSGNALPKVTTSDNGAFLRVVNGKWEKSMLSIAEEVEF